MKRLTWSVMVLWASVLATSAWSQEVRKICTDTQAAVTEKKSQLDQLSSQKVTLYSEMQDLTEQLAIAKIQESVANRPPPQAVGIIHGHVATLENLIHLQKTAVEQYRGYLPKAQQADRLIDEILAGLKAAADQCNVDPASVQRWESFSQDQKTHLGEVDKSYKRLSQLLESHQNLKLALESEERRLQ